VSVPKYDARLHLLGHIVLQTLRQFLKELFRRADAGNYTSIAVPAIGTGNLHIPHAFVAKWMYDEAVEFSRRNPKTRLHDIRFVVYDKDASTVAVTAMLLCQYLLTP